MRRNPNGYLRYTLLGQASLDIYPEVDKEGNVKKFSDYAQLDKLIEMTVASGIPQERIKLWFWLEFKWWALKRNGKTQLEYGTPAYQKAVKAWLNDMTQHVEKKYGISKDRIIFYVVDEPKGSVNDPESRMYQAYQDAKLIKDANSGYRTFVTPTVRWGKATNTAQEDLDKLLEVYDILELHRPSFSSYPAALEWAKKCGKEIWTYSIYSNETRSYFYRRNYWENLRDGFTEKVLFWHLTGHAGSDGFNPFDTTGSTRTDYGTIYADMEQHTWLTGRRQIAHDLGMEDYRLAEYCRHLLKKKNDSTLQRRFDAVVKKAAESDMVGMEHARLELITLAEQLKK